MATTDLKPHWYGTLRQIAAYTEAGRDHVTYATSDQIDLRVARALERRGLLYNCGFSDAWYITEAGLKVIAGDFRPTPDATELAVAQAIAEQLDEMDVTTVYAYRSLSADLIDNIHARAERMVEGTWTPCVRNNREHIGHDEACGEDCLTPAYGYNDMGGFVHTDGETYLHDPATATYKSFTDMEVGDIIAYAGRPEIKIASLNATTATDPLGREFPAHTGYQLDTDEKVTIPFGEGGAAPVKNRPACDRWNWYDMKYRRAVKDDAAAPHLGHAEDALLAEAYDQADAINKAMPRRVPAPECAQPGNLTYELDHGQHIWRLEGSDRTTAIAAWDVDAVTAWAAEAIAAGAVDGIPAGTEVVGWKRQSDDGAEWLTPVLGPSPGLSPEADRDRDLDRDRPVKVNPANVAGRIRHRRVPVSVAGRTETVMVPTRTETETARRVRAETDRDRDRGSVHYLIEKQTGTGWTDVQSGSTPVLYAHPDRTNLETVADTVRSNIGYVLGRGSAAPDVPVRITTWTDGLPDVGYIHLDPADAPAPADIFNLRGTNTA